MSTVKEHYEKLLGPVYAWSVSGAGDPFARAGAWLSATGLDDGATYLDLGAGFGAHVVPLVQAGKQVTAVDFDATLLAQLEDKVGPSKLLTLQRSDILDYLRGPGSWDVILCLGDTLSHLESREEVRELIAAWGEEAGLRLERELVERGMIFQIFRK